MKSLFTNKDIYTPKAVEFQREVEKFWNPIMQEWAKKGYSTRDMEHIADATIRFQGAMFRLKRRLDD